MSVALPALESPRPRQDAAPARWSRLPAAMTVASAALFAVAVGAAQLGAGGSHGAAAPATAFGGTTAVAVPHGGGIERALGPRGHGRLLRVHCAGSTAASPTGCFTALP